MTTQKKSVRLSDASLAVLARNGSDLDTAASRRINAVLQRYGKLLDAQPEHLFHSLDASTIFADAFMHCYHRGQLGLPPLRLDFVTSDGEIWPPFFQDMIETATQHPDSSIQASLEEAATELSAATREVPYQELLYLIEDAEKLAAEVELKNGLSLELRGRDECSVILGGAEIIVDVEQGFSLQDLSDPEHLVLRVIEEEGEEFLGLQFSAESFKEDENWVASLLVDAPAVHVNRRNLIKLAVHMIPYAIGSIQEYKAGQVGDNRVAVARILKEWETRLWEEADLIDSYSHFTEHPSDLHQVVMAIHSRARHHEGPISPFMVTRHLTAYMATNECFLEITQSTLNLIKLKLADLGVEVSPTQ